MSKWIYFTPYRFWKGMRIVYFGIQVGKSSSVFGPFALVCDIHVTPCSPVKVFGVVRLLKVGFFIFIFLLWTVALNSILTIDKFVKRKQVVVNRCIKAIVKQLSTCSCGILFLKVPLVMFGLIYLLTIWRGVCGRHCNRVVWQAITDCIM